MKSRSIRALARALVIAGVCAVGCSPQDQARPIDPWPATFLSDERAPELGADETPIGSLRVSVATGTVNGAGTDNPVLVWFDNQRHELGEDPAAAFARGQEASAVLRGPGLPRTLGELRRTSILLTLHINRAEIGASWFCDRVRVEVRLEGEGNYTTYLERSDVGWLSQDEPPRRSTAYAIQ